MSKHETPMTEGFWMSEAHGAFVPEYPLLKTTDPDRAQRWADAVIFPDERHRRASAAEYPTLTNRRVIIIQTKRGRMGMYLMGQALFSSGLARGQGAMAVRSILLCHRSDLALIPLLRPFPEVEVWLSDPNDPLIVNRVDGM